MKKIIVVIPHYNNNEGLLNSIKSIEEEINVDLIIIDDGSELKIDQEYLIKSYEFGNIYFKFLTKNQGIERALNEGLKFAQENEYDLIGRLDCGDFCKKNRFTKQVNYLDENPDVCLLGTWVNVFDENGDLSYILKHPIMYNKIKKRMYINSTFTHPSVVFRTSLIDNVGFYPTNYEAAEDYAFFFNIIKKFKSGNLPEPLLDYVIDDRSISSKKRKLQVLSRIKIILKNYYLGFYPTYGLIRNLLMFAVSRNFSTRIKKLLFR